ncbi:MAG: protein translocase subunit SecD [Kiloniellales bacterium]|nr:protein translocase subunit SecD [Kiloniellales bacterium]
MVQIPKWQVILAAVVVLLGLAYASPNAVERDLTQDIPSWLPSKKINLGLDLRGGSYLLMEVKLEAALAERLDNIADGIASPLRRARIKYSAGVQDNEMFIDLRDPADMERARELIRNDVQLYPVSQDGPRIVIEVPEERLREIRTSIMSQVIEVIGLRVNETGLTEATVQRQGADRILVQVPGVEDPDRIKEILGKTAQLTFHFVDPTVDFNAVRPPPGHVFMPSAEEENVRYAVQRRAMVRGENLDDAQATYDQYGQPVVSFRFDSVGAKRFGKATQDNVGRIFAIVLDDRVISAPRIQEPILGGSGQISGNFSLQSAQDLALLLRAGALPADVTYLEERTVGASLGEDSIAAGEIACILGMLFVIIFMAISYGSFGLMANVALLANLVMIVAALSVLQATLTLPGIAGIVLTIGMAVDANVLIFERIREEERAGRGPVTAIDTGYRRALTTIIDANLTTLIAATILFVFGTGPIKGFAVTLAIGLVTSMFTAIMVTRVFVVGWLRRTKPKLLPI